MSLYQDFKALFDPALGVSSSERIDAALEAEIRVRAGMIESYHALLSNPAMAELEKYIDVQIDENEPVLGGGLEKTSEHVFTQRGLRLVKKKIAAMRHALKEAMIDES